MRKKKKLRRKKKHRKKKSQLKLKRSICLKVVKAVSITLKKRSNRMIIFKMLHLMVLLLKKWNCMRTI